jgi:hypothetical protein
MINCDPSTIANASACFCGPSDSQRAQMIYLLAQIAGNTMTPTQLAAASVCYNCVPQDLQMAEITMLLCSIATAAGA